LPKQLPLCSVSVLRHAQVAGDNFFDLLGHPHAYSLLSMEALGGDVAHFLNDYGNVTSTCVDAIISVCLETSNQTAF